MSHKIPEHITSVQINRVKDYLLNLQDNMCQSIAQMDGLKGFQEDVWDRTEGGGGRTRVIDKGRVFERGGVNFSHIYGDNLPTAATLVRPELQGRRFQAMGVSSVIHPLNPYCPTAHLNVRLFVAEKDNESPIWWFGGGFDLTPYYGFEEDCQLWHKVSKEACEPFGTTVYPTYKKACDDYFYLKHRQETRGVGGLFFDDLNEWGFEKCFEFQQNVGNGFLKAYLPIIERRKETPYSEREREFQLYRRGRYCEFNLLYDRGTLFGLQSGGRTESILMSMPPLVKFEYNYVPEIGTPERELTDKFLKPTDW